MTTTTAPDVIEGIDMDAVPVCQSVHGCDSVAAWIWIRDHGCRQLVCESHKEAKIRYLAETAYPVRSRCRCGYRSPLRYSPSEVGRWVAL